MNKRILLSTIVGAVVSFALGGIFYGVLLMNFMKANTTHYEGLEKPMNDQMLWIALSTIVWAWLVAYIYDRWAHVTTFMDGAKASMIISGAISLSMDLFYYGAMNLMTGTWYCVDVVLGIVMGGITGGVIAMVQGKVKA